MFIVQDLKVSVYVKVSLKVPRLSNLFESIKKRHDSIPKRLSRQLAITIFAHFQWVSTRKADLPESLLLFRSTKFLPLLSQFKVFLSQGSDQIESNMIVSKIEQII